MTARLRPLLIEAIGPAVALAVGAYALSQTGEMSELGSVFPTTAGILCIAGAIALGLLSALRPRPAAAAEPPDWPRFLGTSVVLVAWALLLDPLGFLASSAAGALALGLIARREPMSPAAILAHLAAGVALIGGFYALLAFVLRVAVP